MQQDLPGLRGFSATNMKSMRLFFEAWFGKIVTSANRQLPTADLQIRDVRKPIGVATYKTDRSVPPAYRRLVPLMNGVNEILGTR